MFGPIVSGAMVEWHHSLQGRQNNLCSSHSWTHWQYWDGQKTLPCSCHPSTFDHRFAFQCRVWIPFLHPFLLLPCFFLWIPCYQFLLLPSLLVKAGKNLSLVWQVDTGPISALTGQKPYLPLILIMSQWLNLMCFAATRCSSYQG